MDSKPSSKMIVVGGAILIALVFFFRARYRSNPPERSPKRDEIPAVENKQPVLLESVKKENPVAQANALKKLRTEVELRDKLGLQRIPLKSANGGFELKVELRARPVWCQGGDLDTIKRVMNDFDSKSVLVSLEPFRRSDLTQNLRVSPREIYAGLKHTFELKNVDAKDSENISLMICSDHKKRGSCKGSKVVDINQLEVAIEKKQPKAVKSDYLFYFQSLAINDSSLFLYRSDDFTKKYKAEIETVFKKDNLPMNNFAESWKTSQAVRSTPLSVENGVLIVSLTTNDPRCSPTGLKR